MSQADLPYSAQCRAHAGTTPGSALLARITFAGSVEEARALADAAPLAVVLEACDLVYVDVAGHGAPWARAHLVTEARS